MALAFWEIGVIGIGVGLVVWFIMKSRGMSIADSMREGGGGDGGW
jgi:hypothetical protein